MILTARQDTLCRYLSDVEKIIPTKTALPALKGILVEAQNNYLRLSSSNLEMGIQVVNRDVEIQEEGRVVLPDNLVDVVRQLDGDEVEIRMDNSDLRVEITGGKAVFVLYGMDADEFPHFTPAEEWNSWDSLSFSAADLKGVVKKIIFAVSHDEGRPLFRAVSLKYEEGGKLTALATDTYRLSRLQRFYKTNFPLGTFNLLVPGRALNEIIKIIENEAGDEVKCYFKENEIIILYRNYTFSSRLVEGKFPEVDGIFPADYKTRIKINKKNLEKLLQRAALLAQGQNQMIMLQVKGDIVHVRASSDRGRMDEEMILEMKEGDDLEEILLNARFLMDPLRILEENEFFIEFNGPLGPCIFCLEQETEGMRELYRYLVLPIKTDRYTS